MNYMQAYLTYGHKFAHYIFLDCIHGTSMFTIFLYGKNKLSFLWTMYKKVGRHEISPEMSVLIWDFPDYIWGVDSFHGNRTYTGVPDIIAALTRCTIMNEWDSTPNYVIMLLYEYNESSKIGCIVEVP